MEKQRPRASVFLRRQKTPQTDATLGMDVLQTSCCETNPKPIPSHGVTTTGGISGGPLLCSITMRLPIHQLYRL